MQPLTKAQKARIAIRIIKTTADALALRGYYKPSGKSGQTLANGLRMLSPEIYGSMNDSRIIELKGLEYVIERLPEGIEKCNRIILTAQDDFDQTSFQKIIPPKRRRISYRISEKEICFVITRGLSEIYDILTHVTFLNIEANKIFKQMKDREGNIANTWKELESVVKNEAQLTGDTLDHALWNLSIILGRTLHETKDTYEHLEKYNPNSKATNVLFHIIHHLGKRVEEEHLSRENELLISFTPSLIDMIGNQSYSEKWAHHIKANLKNLDLMDRPLHIISANLHSVMNTLYGYDSVSKKKKNTSDKDFYGFIKDIAKKDKEVKSTAKKHGLYEIPDSSETHIECQIVDTSMLNNLAFHPSQNIDRSVLKNEKPVILVIDYAFGSQAFEVMDELLEPLYENNKPVKLNIKSISVMGKAGILPGEKNDIMLPTAHVFEGTSDNYIVDNDLQKDDFDDSVNVYVGPMVTVVGTSLQNKDMLNRFQTSSWKAVGLEMEGGHYQKAISSAIIRGHISKKVKIRYAYYASDNPLISGQTLAYGSMGEEGIKPTYMITKSILERILNH
ncbi:MAG: hypothetical protein JRJ39_04520 [Deltaproteobacteria bacterium]|nr:hypothetical protein [Deltaproteobacteria bacterium]MBW2364133.1 hypothetical protein [Deltaproteobacteria bacterium]